MNKDKEEINKSEGMDNKNANMNTETEQKDKGIFGSDILNNNLRLIDFDVSENNSDQNAQSMWYSSYRFRT